MTARWWSSDAPPMKAGQALRQAWRLERADAEVCACGHRSDAHLEPQTTYAIVDGEVVEHVPADYVAGVFHCTAEGCSCRMDISGERRC